jgi:hypothetical protein
VLASIRVATVGCGRLQRDGVSVSLRSNVVFRDYGRLVL